MESKYKFCESIIAKRLESSRFVMFFDKKTGDTFGVAYKAALASIDSLFVPQEKQFFDNAVDNGIPL